MDQIIYTSLSHTHYWYEVGMLKVPARVEQWSEVKAVEFRQPANDNIGVVSVVLDVVYKLKSSSVFLPGCACVHPPTMRGRVKPQHKLVSALYW